MGPFLAVLGPLLQGVVRQPGSNLGFFHKNSEKCLLIGSNYMELMFSKNK